MHGQVAHLLVGQVYHAGCHVRLQLDPGVKGNAGEDSHPFVREDGLVDVVSPLNLVDVIYGSSYSDCRRIHETFQLR